AVIEAAEHIVQRRSTGRGLHLFAGIFQAGYTAEAGREVGPGTLGKTLELSRAPDLAVAELLEQPAPKIVGLDQAIPGRQLAQLAHELDGEGMAGPIGGTGSEPESRALGDDAGARDPGYVLGEARGLDKPVDEARPHHLSAARVLARPGNGNRLPAAGQDRLEELPLPQFPPLAPFERQARLGELSPLRLVEQGRRRHPHWKRPGFHPDDEEV